MPATPQAQPKVFDKLILVSWLNDGGKDIVFVQNTETNEVQKVTKDPNSDSLRLIAIHKDADPKNAEVVLSNGAEEGSVKFRMQMTMPAPQGPGCRHAASRYRLQVCRTRSGRSSAAPGMSRQMVPAERGAASSSTSRAAAEPPRCNRAAAPMQPDDDAAAGR